MTLRKRTRASALAVNDKRKSQLCSALAKSLQFRTHPQPRHQQHADISLHTCIIFPLLRLRQMMHLLLNISQIDTQIPLQLLLRSFTAILPPITPHQRPLRPLLITHRSNFPRRLRHDDEHEDGSDDAEQFGGIEGRAEGEEGKDDGSEEAEDQWGRPGEERGAAGVEWEVERAEEGESEEYDGETATEEPAHAL